MKRSRFLVSLVFQACLMLSMLPVSLSAQDKPDSKAVDEVKQAGEKKSEDEEPKIKTVDVETKSIIVYEAFEGVLESTRTHEVKTNFDTWTDLKIESVVDEGEVVAAGQELLKFDTESIDKAVAQAEFDVKNAQFDLETAKLEMQEVNATFDLDREVAERAWKNSQEDFKYYQNVRLPQQLDDLAYDEKSAGYFLEYSQDELDQLEQMYTEDELTEESEEIVLKRARRSVESSQRARDRSLLRVKRQREMDIPREKLQQSESLKRAETTLPDGKMITLPIKKQKTEIALAQSEFAFANKQKHLKEIKSDQEKMALTAPADGVLYYGRCVRGKWVGASGAAARRLESHKKVPQYAVAMTIVDVSQMMIRANLDEAELESLTPRMRGKALIKAAGNKVMPVMIKSISRIPLDNGKFDCQLTVDNLPADGTVMPGMTCKLSFQISENKQALVVPKDSVFSDDENVSHYVFVMAGGEPKRQDVTVGHTVGSDIEILAGLAAGDKIAKSKP